jgi:hypothetical protein
VKGKQMTTDEVIVLKNAAEILGNEDCNAEYTEEQIKMFQDAEKAIWRVRDSLVFRKIFDEIKPVIVD